VSGVALQSWCDRVYIEKTSKQILKWSKYNLGELEGSNLKIAKCKYIIKTFI
jgi:hypothetical protein